MKRRLNRREFLRRAGGVGGLALAMPLTGCRMGGQQADIAHSSDRLHVGIVSDSRDPVAAAAPTQWAVAEFAAALAERGVHLRSYSASDQAAACEICVIISGIPTAGESVHVPESFAVTVADNAKQRSIQLTGADSLGLVYALTEIADLVRYSPNTLDALRSVKSASEQPKNRIRGVMRLFVSDVEDKSWFHDRSFWQHYLTMLVSQRFNRFNLALGLGYDVSHNLRDTYFFFAYPFLVSVPGYDVRAVGLSDEERDQNLQTLQFISNQAAARGLHFQLGLWTHSFEWVDSPNVNYVIQGLDKDRHAAYCRDALQKILETCPNIRGVTFRVHGESGVAEGSYDFWKTVFDGIVRTGRPIEIDMHAKGMDQRMIDVAMGTGLPVNISPKFWAEHMGLPYHQASIREAEMPTSRQVTGQFALSSGSRSFLRYGYGDLLKADRKYGVVHRIWPGTQRLLLWGDPKFASEYGRIFDFCGSDGVEIFDPLSFKGREGSGLPGGRGAYADDALKPAGGDWEKYLLTYRLWGRMTYNPDGDVEACDRQLHSDLGAAAPALQSALAQSSRILPLITTAHDPSAANANYWPEMYTNMSIVDPTHPGPYTETPKPRVFGSVSPLDPQLFATINDYCASLVSGVSVAKVSPLDVAQQLEDWANGAFADLAKTPSQLNAPARRLQMDCTIAAGLGQFFARKFRAAILFGVFDLTGYEQARQAALTEYRRAREAWAALAAQAKTAYVSDITFGPTPQLRGNWIDRLTAIDQDMTAMEQYQRPAGEAETTQQMASDIVTRILSRQNATPLRIDHTPPTSFQRGESIKLKLEVPATVSSLRLWYKRVDQAERFVSMELPPGVSSLAAEIGGRFTDSPFAIQYYFESRDLAGIAHLHPGFGADFCGQPYYLVRQAAM